MTQKGTDMSAVIVLPFIRSHVPVVIAIDCCQCLNYSCTPTCFVQSNRQCWTPLPSYSLKPSNCHVCSHNSTINAELKPCQGVHIYIHDYKATYQALVSVWNYINNVWHHNSAAWEKHTPCMMQFSILLPCVHVMVFHVWWIVCVMFTCCFSHTSFFHDVDGLCPWDELSQNQFPWDQLPIPMRSTSQLINLPGD